MKKKVVHFSKKLVLQKEGILNLQSVSGGGDEIKPVSFLTKEGPCGTCVGASVGECGPGTGSFCQGNCSVNCITQGGQSGC